MPLSTSEPDPPPPPPLAGAVEDSFSIISQTEKFNIPVRASISSSGTATNALAQPPKGFVTMPAQSTSSASRVTASRDEPKPVPDFLARDWVVDPNLSLGEVQVCA
jgi:hypothetical protein